MPLVVKMPPLHEAQREAREASRLKRFVTLVCGRRWGKTSYGVLTGLDRALRGKLVWWVAPTLSQSRIAKRILRKLVRSLPKDLYKEHRSEGYFEFASGGSFYFKTADEPDNLRGEGLDYVIIDEADFIDEEIWTDIIRPALADKRGGALLCSTPRIENGWFHKLFIRGSDDNDQQYVSLCYPSWTNKLIDPTEFDAVRRDLPQLVFRREFGAEFVSNAGTRVQKSWLKYGIPPAFKAISIGVDLAISEQQTADFSAFVVTGVDILNRLWVIHAERDRLSFNGIIEKIKSLSETFEPNGVFVESVQFQASVVQEIARTTSIPVKKVRADKSKISRFQVAEVKYENMLMHHTTSLPDEFEEELLAFPAGSHDDFVDALAHSLRGLMNLSIDDDDLDDALSINGDKPEQDEDIAAHRSFQRDFG